MADDILDVLDPDPLFDLDAALAAHAEARPGLTVGEQFCQEDSRRFL